ncbi:hypothetical protein [Nocardioides solisilvae]|uniref:hypothetical protein n=1 Tax=Nocardioides solisilvae TaxID=1542435 RepID=UPI000D74A51A|nr:hypothetical protein [Nocardioides solisilvae]
MLPDPTTGLTGAVDAAVSRLKSLNVSDAEIAKIRNALLTAGEALRPGLVQPVAARNFGERGHRLAQHTELVHQRFVEAIRTMAQSFDTQSDSLRQFTAEIQTKDEESSAHLRALQAATDRVAQRPWQHAPDRGDR